MTAHASSSVKQALLTRLQEAVLPQLQQLVESLPDELTSFAQAEQQVRQAMLEAARKLLTVWTDSADRLIARPCCPRCKMPMRNKGSVGGVIATLVGSIRIRRPRWRCLDYGEECYPHDERIRFGNHAVSWALARVCGRPFLRVGSPQPGRRLSRASGDRNAPHRRRGSRLQGDRPGRLVA
ncbi:MAG: hypothetical protein U0744_17465 [Gemmataceae bacterium]